MFGSLLKVPRQVFTSTDDRYTSSRIRPINMSGHAEGRKSGRDGADQEEIFGQCDKSPVKVATDARMPTQREIDEYCVTHLPHRLWCEVCIKARGREDAHASQKGKGAKPTIAMDYKFGEAEDSEDKDQDDHFGR